MSLAVHLLYAKIFSFRALAAMASTVGLQSTLLRGDPKLEAAAVSDPAHVTPGARGPHVEKIQRALNTIDNAGLVEDGIYGSATAASVLVYKRARKIINFRYQTQADNIVGKGTIASLDSEMLAREVPPVDVVIYRLSSLWRLHRAWRA
jgi:peptidoglycan hydrolase-like protein with peptidoglycan-binding domain